MNADNQDAQKQENEQIYSEIIQSGDSSEGRASSGSTPPNSPDANNLRHKISGIRRTKSQSNTNNTHWKSNAYSPYHYPRNALIPVFYLSDLYEEEINRDSN